MIRRRVSRMSSRFVAFVSLLAVSSPLPAAAAEKEPPVLEITQDTVLDPAKTYGRIVIKASGMTVDGRGAWLVGATQGEPKTFKHTAVSAKGVSRVTLKNVNAKGWETGLTVEDGERWLVEGCNFSDNFHDPDFGWGEHGRRGGIVLKQCPPLDVPQQQGQPRVGRLRAGRFAREHDRGERFLAHVEHVPEAVDRLPQHGSARTTSATACGSSPARSTPAIRRAC